MKRQNSCLAVSLLLLFAMIPNVYPATILPRKSSRCAFLNNKIYCYGGILTIPGQWPLKSSSELFSLDIHNSSIQNNINDGWQYTLSTGRSNLASTERGYPQAVPHPDGTSLLITGGITDKENLQTNTILYNASSNSWEAVDGMPDPSNGGERQMYHGVGVYAPETNRYYFHGGFQWLAKGGINSWFYDSPSSTNFTGLPVSGNSLTNVMFLGYYRMTSLTLNSGSSHDIWDLLPAQTNIPPISYFQHSGVYHPKSRTIYYFGGSFTNVFSYNGDYYQPLGTSITFNTATSSWGKQTFNGPVPQGRIFHTTTLLPSLNDVLLYGGADKNTPAFKDFCYTASLENFTWVYHSYLKLSDGSSAARAEHEAVLVGTDLYILFGANSNNSLSSNTLTLDVSNPSALSFKEAVVSPTPVTANSSNNNGAVIGGAVGGALGGVLILAAIIFYVRKKKRSEKNDREELSVDWDEIEGRFTETSPAGLPQPAGSIIMSQPATSTTAVSPPIASADIIATDTKIHATETNNSNERVLRPDIPQIIKPDIEIPKN